MINLIPPDAHRRVVLEYWVRVVTVWSLLVAIGCSMVALFFVPTFVLIESQLHVYAQTATQASTQQSTFATLQSSVAQANTIAQQLASDNNTQLFSTYITDINSLSNANVVVQGIQMQRTKGAVQTIMVTGTATTRATLAAFRDSLEAFPAFKTADLPLSNLAKDKDITFTITVTVAN